MQPGRFVADSHGSHAADDVLQDGIFQDVPKNPAVGGGHELHSPLGSVTHCGGLCRPGNLVDDEDLGAVVQDRLQDDAVLRCGVGHGEPPREPQRRVWHVTMPPQFHLRVNSHDPPP